MTATTLNAKLPPLGQLGPFIALLIACVEYDSGVRVNLIEPTTASAAGSAVALVDGFAGRCPTTALEAALPPDFAAHLVRAAHVL